MAKIALPGHLHQGRPLGRLLCLSTCMSGPSSRKACSFEDRFGSIPDRWLLSVSLFHFYWQNVLLLKKINILLSYFFEIEGSGVMVSASIVIVHCEIYRLASWTQQFHG